MAKNDDLDDEIDEDPSEDDLGNEEVADTRRCPHCKAEIYEDLDICPRCGTAIYQPAPVKWAARIILLLLIGLVIAALVAWMLG